MTKYHFDLFSGSYENCCLKYIVGVRKSMRRNIESYRVQETDGGCNIPAIVWVCFFNQAHKTQSLGKLEVMIPVTLGCLAAITQQFNSHGCRDMYVFFSFFVFWSPNSFKLKRSKTLCADPRQNWVQQLMQKIDGKKTGPK